MNRIAGRSRSTRDVALRTRAVRAFNRRGLRWPLGLAGSLIVSIRNGEACLVTPMRDGLFAHHYRAGTVVYPSFRGLSPGRMNSETLDTFCWKYMPQPGDTILDIGAGIGEEAITFSRLVGPRGLVVSVEAEPSTYRRLAATIRLNKLDNVMAVHAAITDETGSVRIDKAAVDTHVGASLTRSGGFEVPAETLDGLTARLGLGDISLLKMNIEGAERQALLAASETLARADHLAISCHDFLVPHGAEPARVATFHDVREILERQRFAIAGRPHDSRPWIRYYIYAWRNAR